MTVVIFIGRFQNVSKSNRPSLQLFQCFEVNFGEFGLRKFGEEADFARDFVFGEVLLIDIGKFLLDGALGGVFFGYDEDDNFLTTEFVFATDGGASIDFIAFHGDIFDVGRVDIVAVADNHALESRTEVDEAGFVDITDVASTEVFFAANRDEGFGGFFGLTEVAFHDREAANENLAVFAGFGWLLGL